MLETQNSGRKIRDLLIDQPPGRYFIANNSRHPMRTAMKPLPSNDESIHYRKSPVLYAFLFFGLTFLLTMMGQVTQAYASKNFPLMTWLPYAQFVVGTPPSIAGLLLLILIYRWQGLTARSGDDRKHYCDEKHRNDQGTSDP